MHEHVFTSAGKVVRERFLHALRVRQIGKLVLVVVEIHHQSETELFEIACRLDFHELVVRARDEIRIIGAGD